MLLSPTLTYQQLGHHQGKHWWPQGAPNTLHLSHLSASPTARSRCSSRDRSEQDSSSRKRRPEETGVEAMEAATRVLAAILASDSVDDANKKWVAISHAADAVASAASLPRVMRGGSTLEARVDAARLAELLLANAGDEAKAAAVAESSDLLAELVRLVGTVDEKGAPDRNTVDADLSYLAAVWGSRHAAHDVMVRLGMVLAAVRDLRVTTEPGVSVKALRVLESAVGSADGRAALCVDADDAIPAVLGKMMKAGRDGAEAAVAVLWAVCHRYRDRRAADAAVVAEGGLTRLLMQSGCSLAARRMAQVLLKLYRVNAKSYLACYDSKTHPHHVVLRKRSGQWLAAILSYRPANQMDCG